MIEKLTALAADIDDTLLPKGKTIMPRTRAALQRLHYEGVLIGPASGRPLDYRTLDKAKEWELGFDFDFAIGMNGGELYDAKTDSYEKYFLLSPEEIRLILEPIAHLDINAIVYANGYDEVYALRMDAFMRDSIARNHSKVEIGGVDLLSSRPTGKVEIHLQPENLDEFMAICKAHEDPRWICVKTFEGFGHVTMEFVDPRVNKGYALRKYGEKHNIPMEEVMAFGDMDNDYGLIKEAGWGVCLLNGSDNVKSIAQAVTDYTVEEDGVGRYLEDHWFKD